jgi:hypothetical protein
VYCVNRERLHVASQAVREILQAIASEYLLPSGRYEPFLPALAHAGEELRTAVFSPVNGVAVDSLVAYVDRQPAGTPLAIFSDGSVQVPWNFMFSGDVNRLPAPTGRIEDFDDFWTSRLKVNVRYIATDIPPDRPISREGLKTLLALHRSRFNKAEQILQKYPEIHAQLQELRGFEVGESNDWDGCRSKWEQIARNDSIVYIFAHADQNKLYLLEEDEIDPASAYKYAINTTGFQTIFRKAPNANTNTLCFINGCRTADGKLGDGFLSITSSPGFHGFIGSEAEISEEWATRYAVQFLHGLIVGAHRVQDVYDEMRTQCFPLSLWYSCCAHPDFSVVPA